MIASARLLIVADYQLWGGWTFVCMVFEKSREIPDLPTRGINELFMAAVRNCHNIRPCPMIVHLELGISCCGLPVAGVGNLRCTSSAIYNV